MIKMSFYNGTLNRNTLAEFIRSTDKPIVYTIGYEYKHPTTHRKPISKNDALKIANEEFYLDVDEEPECLHLNAYTDNDMF